jgi:uncharacterized protein (TIGR02145 family)
MKKHLILLFLVIFSASNSFGQSKKEQIEQLNYRVDSLIQVLSSERTTIKQQKAWLEQQKDSLEQQIVDLNSSITKMNAQATRDNRFIKSKELELSKVSSELSSLTSLLKVKSDSLNLVLAELEKLKPPVKVAPVIPVVDNKGPVKGVAIGTQVWTTKNLDVATFRNGDAIPQAKTNEEWKSAGENKQPAWCYYENKASNGTKYGKLYNWYAVNDYRGLAPAGWHVPTDYEWTVLKNLLGDDAGKKMKSSSGWDSYKEDITCSNCKSWNAEYRRKKECNVCQDTRVNGKKTFSGNGTNSSGFSGLPGGCCYSGAGFADVGSNGNWWSASGNVGAGAWGWRLVNDVFPDLNGHDSYMDNGFSVRCVKD